MSFRYIIPQLSLQVKLARPGWRILFSGKPLCGGDTPFPRPLARHARESGHPERLSVRAKTPVDPRLRGGDLVAREPVRPEYPPVFVRDHGLQQTQLPQHALTFFSCR
jgi:hypothetical protein